ncbi:MAG: VOC family protein [Hyphomicrobiales bacterium]|nr:VOC family protein [Hyphomicrobiales bacterium]
MAKFTWDHIHLKTPDPEAMAQWFSTMLDAEVIHRQGAERVDLKLGGANIFIGVSDGHNEPPQIPYRGLEHFGLLVSGIDAIAAELKARGCEFTKEPTTVRPGIRVCFIRGPQGISIELLERTKT